MTPWRGIWIVSPGDIELMALLGLGPYTGVLLGAVLAVVALAAAWRAGIARSVLVFGSSVGFAVGAGWLLTAMIAQQAFDPVPIESLTFSGPSADTLMFIMTAPDSFDFDIGLIPGVFLGAALAARPWRRG